MTKPKTHQVKFKAHKTLKKRVKVEFPTKDGPVEFKAKKPIKKLVQVKFKARNK